MKRIEYPDDLAGYRFGTLTVLGRAPGYENENKMWLCRCECGRPECKGTVVVRRGNLTRRTSWKLTCGANGNNAEQSAMTKLLVGTVQKNSRTGYPGVNHSCCFPGLYRARISVHNDRFTVDGLTLHEALLVRGAWEIMARVKRKAALRGANTEDGDAENNSMVNLPQKGGGVNDLD